MTELIQVVGVFVFGWMLWSVIEQILAAVLYAFVFVVAPKGRRISFAEARRYVKKGKKF